jgi:plasmid stability protein
MSVMIQIKDVPDEVHRTLKARAAENGQSLSEFLRGELAKVATRPTWDDLRRRIESQPPLEDLSPSPADLIREMRDAHDGFYPMQEVG